MRSHLPAGGSARALCLCLAAWMSLAAAPVYADSGPLAYPEGATLQKEVFRLGRLEIILAEHAWLAARHRPVARRTAEPRLNERLLSTLGRPHEREGTAQALADAASAGNATAPIQRAALVLAGLADDHGADAAALDTLVAATKSGDALAATLLGQALVEGRALDRDLAEARHLWQQAAERGQIQAQWLLGRALIAGLGGPVDHAQGWAWLAAAEKAGSPQARDLRASLRATGLAQDRPSAEGLSALTARARAGDTHAQHFLGDTLILGGPALSPNPALGRVWLERAAAAGRAAACASLAYWWAARDEPDAAPKARAWALAGAALGDLPSEELAGAYLLKGFGGSADQDAALPHLLSAVNRGSPYATTLLASLKLRRDRSGDVESARQYLHAAANGGDSDAQFMLGQMLATGQGGPAEPQAARQWMTLAAQSGHAEAAAWLKQTPE